MSENNFELVGVSVDSLTGKAAMQAIFFRSGARCIFIGVETIKAMVEFLKEKNILING